MDLAKYLPWLTRILLLVAFGLHLLRSGAAWIGVARDSRTAIEANAIQGGTSFGICSHHPQGCPKDCLCPKIHLDAVDHGGFDKASLGILFETSWVQCTDSGPAGLNPEFAVFIPGKSGILPQDATEAPLGMLDIEKLLLLPKEPPEKIPV